MLTHALQRKVEFTLSTMSRARFYDFDRFRLDVGGRQLFRDGEAVALTPKAFDTLLALVENRDRLVEKQELMRMLWPDTAVEEANLTQNVFTLRKALGDQQDEPRYIVTLPRRGYRFVAEVSEAPEVEEQPAASVVSAAARARPEKRRGRFWAASAAALLVVAATAGWYVLRSARDARPLRVSVLPPEGSEIDDSAVSPDGRHIAFSARDESGFFLYVRALESLETTRMRDTQGAGMIFWSPDGRSIGFFAGGKLMKIGLDSGPPQAICSAGGRGGTWSRDGLIVFAPRHIGGLYRVSASGGEPTPVTTLDGSLQEIAHRWPQFLPDGRHFLYFAMSTAPENNAVYAGSLDGKERKRILTTSRRALYSPPGYLLSLSETGMLTAQPFDATRLELSGEALPIAEEVAHLAPTLGFGLFSVSENGVLAYQGRHRPRNQLGWLDRASGEFRPIGAPSEIGPFELSPDGRRLALQEPDPQTGFPDIWLLDLSTGARSRFTFHPLHDVNPVWSPDGTRIVFASSRSGDYQVYWKLASGAGEEERLFSSSTTNYPCDWSPDGRFILFESGGGERTRMDLWVLSVVGERKAHPFLQTEFNERRGQFSPDGRCVAYWSNESGRPEVYVRGFETGGGKWQVSSNHAWATRWREDGKELFYQTADSNIVSVEVKPTASDFIMGRHTPLWSIRPLGMGKLVNWYEVAPDGTRLLINAADLGVSGSSITLVLNWTAASGR